MRESDAPYGMWPSPITPAALSLDKRLSDVCWDTASESLVWLEGRSGQNVLVAAEPGGDAPRDLTPALSARARVGYGGGDMSVAHGRVLFSADGRLHCQELDSGAAQTITPPSGDVASPSVSPDGKWVVYVHSDQHDDCLAVVDAAGEQWPQKLAAGADFYMQPAWHPDGARLAYIAWDHPLMPWEGTRLHLAHLEGGGDGAPHVAMADVVAGGNDVSIFQPTFSPDGRYLAYVSDATGWYGLYLYDLVEHSHRTLWADQAELAIPAWAQGMRTYAWRADSQALYAIRSVDGGDQLWLVPLDGRAPQRVEALARYTSLGQIAVSATGMVALIASSPKTPARVLTYDPASSKVRIVARASSESVSPEALCAVEPISWAADDGEPIHGLLYLPQQVHHGDTLPQADNRPPLIVHVHGGPTGQATLRYAGQMQFFATRGYAVLDVNYRGSSGYGRHYRDLLRGNWGIYDADDAVAGARSLVERGLVDGSRMVIMGGSAGGYTVLQSLIRYPGAFKAGLCLYGVTNLFTLASDTHKFEKHYLDSLIGPLPATAQRYRDRSPIFSADRISDPVAVFQGEDDRVVPKAQAETIVAALQHAGVPHEYHLYPGEGHGWRKSETIAAFNEAALRFLNQYVIYG